MVKYGIEIFARVKPGKGRLGVRNLTGVYGTIVNFRPVILSHLSLKTFVN